MLVCYHFTKLRMVLNLVYKAPANMNYYAIMCGSSEALIMPYSLKGAISLRFKGVIWR